MASISISPSSSVYGKGANVEILLTDFNALEEVTSAVLDAGSAGSVYNGTIDTGFTDENGTRSFEATIPSVTYGEDIDQDTAFYVYASDGIDGTSSTFTIHPALAAGTLSAGTPTDTSVVMTWSGPTGGNEAGYTYQLQRSPNGSSNWTNVAGGSPNTVTGLTASTTYYFRVRFDDSAGSIADSNVVSITTTSTPSEPTSELLAGQPLLHLVLGGGNII